MLPRPRFRLPLWAAVAIVAAVYLLRSVSRGMDFHLDWPSDAVVLGLFAIVLLIVGYVRRLVQREETGEPAESAQDNESPPTS